MRMKLGKYVDVQSAHYLNKEYCFFDSKHRRLNEFITITSAIYHPLLKSQIILATIDCKHEDTSYVERFWHIFNSAYKEVNMAIDKLNFTGWRSDMTGANFNGLKKIYIENVVKRLKDKSHDFHFKESINKNRRERTRIQNLCIRFTYCMYSREL